MTEIHSYSKIFNLGHPEADPIFDGPVIIEEKVDVSQLSFGLLDGELVARSKGQSLNVSAPEKMFAPAVETAKRLAGEMRPGWVYRAEAVCRPKHNTLHYARCPEGFLILYDIETAPYRFLSYPEKAVEAARLGLDCVPLLLDRKPDNLDEMLDRESILGGPQIEGFVIKPAAYDLFGRDKKVLMAKYVSEKFKETHKREWKAGNPSNTDVLVAIAGRYGTEATWEKAIQRLRDEGRLTGDVKDIGPLIKTVQDDVANEWEAEIARDLLKWAMPHVRRKSSSGLAEWYKRRIAEQALVQEPR